MACVAVSVKYRGIELMERQLNATNGYNKDTIHKQVPHRINSIDQESPQNKVQYPFRDFCFCRGIALLSIQFSPIAIVRFIIIFYTLLSTFTVNVS
jgi:hypothetical protein